MESRIVPILKVLSESSEPLGATLVSRRLRDQGINLSERSVRYHFLITDIRGYTKLVVHDGRILTPKGLEELKGTVTLTALGSIQEKLETQYPKRLNINLGVKNGEKNSDESNH